jgi:hypothetical protein
MTTRGFRDNFPAIIPKLTERSIGFHRFSTTQNITSGTFLTIGWGFPIIGTRVIFPSASW